MSRILAALTRAGQMPRAGETEAAPARKPPRPADSHFWARLGSRRAAEIPSAVSETLGDLIERIQELPWNPNPDAHIIDKDRPSESPTEEFRSLRTRLNHLKGQRPLSTLVVTSPSPAEGKSFTASNLAVVQSHLQGNLTLLCDFDFRRPLLHNIFGAGRSPGLTDFLQGRAPLHEVIRRVADTNLFLAPAGSAVLNPLELLSLARARQLFEQLPTLFSWVILDSPPLLFAADANLLSTMTDGTLLVVRLGHTSIDSVTRAIQSMSHNNVIGVVANGAKRGELYNKYAYYHASHPEPKPNGSEGTLAEAGFGAA